MSLFLPRALSSPDDCRLSVDVFGRLNVDELGEIFPFLREKTNRGSIFAWGCRLLAAYGLSTSPDGVKGRE
jgi:hypothetical protein